MGEPYPICGSSKTRAGRLRRLYTNRHGPVIAPGGLAVVLLALGCTLFTGGEWLFPTFRPRDVCPGHGVHPAAAPVQRSAGDPAALDALRRLHRDLVALSLGWEELLDLALPTAGSWSGAHGTPAKVSAPQVPSLLTPLPSGVVMTQPGSGGVGYQYPGVGERLPLGLRLVSLLDRGITRLFMSRS